MVTEGEEEIRDKRHIKHNSFSITFKKKSKDDNKKGEQQKTHLV